MKFFNDKTFLKSIIALSVPIALQNLIMSVLNIFDQTMVGFLPKEIADYCLSAVLLANQVVFIFQIVLFAVCNTVNIFIAQYTHNGKKELIPQRIGMVLVINTTIAIVANILCFYFSENIIGMFNPKQEYAQYAADFLKLVSCSFVPMSLSVTFSFVLRAMKKLNVPLAANILAVFFNIFFNYIFMFGGLGIEPMGLLGAAVGTILSRTIELILVMLGLLLFKYPIFAKPKIMFKTDKKFTKQYFKMFFPILCNELFWVLSSTVYLFVYDKLPNSEVVLSAVNIAQSVDKIISVAMIGVGSAAGVIMSNVIAKNDKKEVTAYKNMTIQFGLIVGGVIAVLTLGSAFVAPTIFKNVSLDAQTTARNLLLLYGFSAIIRSLNFVIIIGILRSGGDTTFCFQAETFLIWLVSVPLVLIGGLVFKLNIYWLYILSMISEVLKFVAFYKRSRGCRWIKFNDGGNNKTE